MRIKKEKLEAFQRKLEIVNVLANTKGYNVGLWRCNGFKPRTDKNPVKVRTKIERSNDYAFSTFTFGLYPLDSQKPRYSIGYVKNPITFNKWSDRFEVIDKFILSMLEM